MISMRLIDCERRQYGEILAILHAPMTETAAQVLQSILPDLAPAKSIRTATHAGGMFQVHGGMVGWHPIAPPQAPAPPAPSLLDQAASIVGALARAVGAAATGTNPVSSPDLVAQRIVICQACPMLGPQGACSRCGCAVQRKAALATERCPDGRW